MTTEQAMIQSGEICCDCRVFINDDAASGKPRICYACERAERLLFGDHHRKHESPLKPR